MPDEGFLKRWSRRKIESRLGYEPEPEPQPPQEALAPGLPPAVQALADSAAPGAGERAHADVPEPVPAREANAAPAPRLPTLDDVDSLTPDSDYSSFVARGVDQAVRRSALKKLFADPHFKAMDRLDVYIDDYTKPSPVSEAMLASLRHAARLFERVADGDAEAGAAPLDTPATETAAPQDQAIAAADGEAAARAPVTPTTQEHSPETETR
jgi:hypothetical protein